MDFPTHVLIEPLAIVCDGFPRSICCAKSTLSRQLPLKSFIIFCINEFSPKSLWFLMVSPKPFFEEGVVCCFNRVDAKASIFFNESSYLLCHQNHCFLFCLIGASVIVIAFPQKVPLMFFYFFAACFWSFENRELVSRKAC